MATSEMGVIPLPWPCIAAGTETPCSFREAISGLCPYPARFSVSNSGNLEGGVTAVSATDHGSHMHRGGVA
jgi:hypothetical protein